VSVKTSIHTLACGNQGIEIFNLYSTSQ